MGIYPLNASSLVFCLVVERSMFKPFGLIVVFESNLLILKNIEVSLRGSYDIGPGHDGFGSRGNDLLEKECKDKEINICQ